LALAALALVVFGAYDSSATQMNQPVKMKEKLIISNVAGSVSTSIIIRACWLKILADAGVSRRFPQKRCLAI